MRVTAIGAVKTDLRFPKGSKRKGKRIYFIEVVRSGVFTSSKTSILTEGEYREKVGGICKRGNSHLPALLSKKEASDYMGLYDEKYIGRNPSKL